MLRGGFEEHADELDLTYDAWLLTMDVAAFDGSDRFNPAEGCLCRSQGSKALAASKEAFHRRVIAFDQVVTPLSIDMSDAIKMGIISMVYLTDDTTIAVRLIGADRNRTVETNA